jgi:glycosyltransferase involved in cell wall biosynthesis
VSVRDFGLTNSRLPLMSELVDRGWRVVAACRDEGRTAPFGAIGVEHVDVPFARGGPDPLADLRAVRVLRRLYRTAKPRLAHHFNVKPIVLGSLAARGSGASVICTVTGFGYGLTGYPVLSPVVDRVIGSSLRGADAVIFQNPDDLELAERRGWDLPEVVDLVVSSGVDTGRFTPGRSRHGPPHRVLMISRLLRQKGVEEFIAAAARCSDRELDVEFVLGGEEDPGHPDAVPPSVIRSAVDRGLIRHIGYVDDVAAELRRSAVFVLPSRYREGVPRVLLEAGACGVPVVTLDTPGCRDVVKDGHTGRVLSSQNPDAIATAVEEIVTTTETQRAMGTAARQHVESSFDIRDVTARQLGAYRRLGVLA